MYFLYNCLQETRQRQLDSLRRMEDRLKSLASVEQKAREKAAASKAKATDNAAVASPAPPSEEGLQERVRPSVVFS